MADMSRPILDCCLCWSLPCPPIPLPLYLRLYLHPYLFLPSVCMCVCMCSVLCVYVCMFSVCMFSLCMFSVCMVTVICIHVCIYICMYTCMYICTGGELKRRANQLFRHNLTGLLEGCVRTCNAQFEPSYVLDRLGVRLLEPSPGNSWEYPGLTLSLIGEAVGYI
jgi:hypothetical protein